MLQALFSSRVRVRLLTLFLLSPVPQFHASELARQVGARYNAVWKELGSLERAGLLLSEPAANTKMYRLNPRYPILPELRMIILKTEGAGDAIRQAFVGMDVDAVFIYGSFAAGEADPRSDIDVMVIGKVDLTRLTLAVARLEKSLGRAVNYVAFSPEEWIKKRRAREPFVANVLASPKIMLIGDEDALRTAPTTRTHQALPSARGGNPKIAQSRRTRPRRS